MSYLNCKEAAEVARCSVWQIRELIKSGKLKAFKQSKGYLITPGDLKAYIESNKK